jgi:hypothetical protein
MKAHRLNGRYCALQTVNQSERAANDRARLPENTAAWTIPPPKAVSLGICSPVLVYNRLISQLRFETMASTTIAREGREP